MAPIRAGGDGNIYSCFRLSSLQTGN
jgi:hypothetical protein